jgi:hypothetical protein
LPVSILERPGEIDEKSFRFQGMRVCRGISQQFKNAGFPGEPKIILKLEAQY